MPSADTDPRDVATATDPAEIGARLRLSATRLARQLRQQADTDMTPSLLSALAVIHNQGPLTLGALADQERVAPPSITKIVAKLEAEGLVARAADPTDGRVSLVATTPAGEALIAETRRRKTTWLTARVRDLTDDERRRLADALDVLDQLTTDRP